MNIYSTQLIETANKAVADYFADTANKGFTDIASNPTTKYSSIFSSLMQVKGPDILKVADTIDPLEDWDRTMAYGGWLRSIAIGIQKPINAPDLVNGSSPDPFVVSKPAVVSGIHDFRNKFELSVSIFEEQLRDSFQNPEELGMVIAGTINSLSAGFRDDNFRTKKQFLGRVYINDYTAADRNRLTVDIGAITSTDSAKSALTAIRDQITGWRFSKGTFNQAGFYHSVNPMNITIYFKHDIANKLSDYLQVANYTKSPTQYYDVLGTLSQYIGCKVRYLDDFGGLSAFGEATPGSGTFTVPLTRTYGANGGTVGWSDGTADYTGEIEWKPSAQSTALNFDQIGAVIVEDGSFNKFQTVLTTAPIFNPRSGGYTNQWLYSDSILTHSPYSNQSWLKIS